MSPIKKVAGVLFLCVLAGGCESKDAKLARRLYESVDAVRRDVEDGKSEAEYQADDKKAEGLRVEIERDNLRSQNQSHYECLNTLVMAWATFESSHDRRLKGMTPEERERDAKSLAEADENLRRAKDGLDHWDK